MGTTSEVNHRLASLFRNLGNGIRIEILDYLQEEKEDYVGGIAEQINRPQNTASRHLKTLSDYDLVQSETRGRKKFFRVKRLELVKACLELRALLSREG